MACLLRLRALLVGGQPRCPLWQPLLLLVLTVLPGCSPPEPLPDPGIFVGENLVQKTLLFERAELGRIRSVTVGQFGPDPQVELVVGGNRGAAFLTGDGVERSFVAFDNQVTTAVPIDVDGDGIYEFMGRGGGWSPVSLLDHEGNTLWRLDRIASAAPDQMAAGDLDGDGRLEFIIGMNGAGGLHQFDDQGVMEWTREGSNISSVAVLDTDGDGQLEIVHSGRAGLPWVREVWIRNSAGEIIRKLRPGFESFSLTPWPEADSGRLLLGGGGGAVKVVDFFGELVAQFDAAGIGHSLLGSPVRLDESGRQYFAVVSTLRATARRSALHIFGPDGEVVYYEVLPFPGLALGVLGSTESDAEVMVVGGGSTLWTYRFNVDG